MMRKILIAAVSAILAPVLMNAQAQINTKMAKIEDFTEKVTEVVLTGNMFFDQVFKDEVSNRWRISPFEFCTLDEFENMKSSGMQSTSSYKTVSDKWMQKCKDALKLFLDEQQYIRYLKHIGEGKEYKKGKDGLYYKKEEKAKAKSKK